jgi:hypothetical protein
MKGARGEIIYVGKAVNLRNRVRGYFTGAAAESLLAEGATEVYAAATHPVFSGKAVQRLEESPIRTCHCSRRSAR